MNNNAQAEAIKRHDSVHGGVGRSISRDGIGHSGATDIADLVRGHDGLTGLPEQEQGRKIMRVPALSRYLTHYLVFVSIVLLMTMAVQGGI